MTTPADAAGRGGPSELVLELPCAHRAVTSGRHLAEDFAVRAGLPADELDRLLLVISELLANAVDHGGGNGAMEPEDLAGDVRMGLELVVEQTTWLVVVTDEGGGGGAVGEVLDPVGQAAAFDERGRGLFLVRELADSVSVGASVRAGRPGGMRFEVRKRFGPSAEPGHGA